MPIAPMVRVQKKSTRQNHRYGPEHPAFPARWFTGLYALSPVPGLLATVIGTMHGNGRFDTSFGISGPRDFAVRRTPLVRASALRCSDVHRIADPTFRDDAYAPHPDRNGGSIDQVF
ncbi:hypothetical protein SSBR45G_63210 [Bradyrhizobium sp. SSBR45G]|nr:hypothetical protein SSBR45G_63210 [Bradyrhizobium sp. SSBR45G]GLH88819.1 hypothetical protein SSBR45R_62800 [Bradyrhizobium sp. SSBR45R]